MYIHRDPDLTFLAMERAGSRSVAALLREHFGFELVGDHHDGPEQGHEVVGTPFTIVRNHWDWLASHWWGVHGDLEGDFIRQEWIIDRVLGDPSVFRPGRTFRFLTVPKVFPLRFEMLEDEVLAFLSMHGLDTDGLTLPHEGESDDRDGASFVDVYTPHAARLVAWLWQPEIRELGYQFRRG